MTVVIVIAAFLGGLWLLDHHENVNTHDGKMIHGKMHYTEKAHAGKGASAPHTHGGQVYYSSDHTHVVHKKTHPHRDVNTIDYETHTGYEN